MYCHYFMKAPLLSRGAISKIYLFVPVKRHTKDSSGSYSLSDRKSCSGNLLILRLADLKDAVYELSCRSIHNRFFSDQAWDDPKSYDLMLNTSTLGYEGAAEAIIGAMNARG